MNRGYTKTIWLVRHGESEANAGLPTEHPETIPLTEKGQRQAQSAADSLKQELDLRGGMLDSIIVSPFIRTQRTAVPTKENYSYAKVSIWPIHEYTYLSPGMCVGTTVSERRPMIDQYWGRADPEFVHGPGAESFSAFCGRVERALELINRLPAGNHAIFGHAQFFKALLLTLAFGSLPKNNLMSRFREEEVAAPIAHANPIRFQWFDSTSTFNRAHALRYLDGDEVLLSRLIEMFVQSVGAELRALRGATVARQYFLAAQVVHRIKPSVAMLCDPALADACSSLHEQLGLAARSGTDASLAAAVGSMAQLMHGLGQLSAVSDGQDD
jgi:broad specificity phosphatase PhoE/HPt (histidine-containing phosphotransfer) domain-containing protein